MRLQVSGRLQIGGPLARPPGTLGAISIREYLIQQRKRTRRGRVNRLEISPVRVVGRRGDEHQLGKTADDGEMVSQVMSGLLGAGHGRA